MKNSLAIVLFLFFCGTAFTQIPNADFEDWTNFGSYEDPDDWGTINSLTSLLGVKTATKSSDKYSGSYALRLESKTGPLQGTAPGIAATGTINPSTQNVDGGIAYSQRPYALSGWYKYQPAGTDEMSIEVTFTKWNSSTNQRDIIGEAEFTQNTAVNSYTQFVAPITYHSSAAPDTFVIIMLTSSGGSSSPAGSVLFIDDLAFADSTTAIFDAQIVQHIIFPNPASRNLTIELEHPSRHLFSIFTIEGKLLFEKEISAAQNTLSIAHLNDGNFIYSLKKVNSEKTQFGKLTIQK